MIHGDPDGSPDFLKMRVLISSKPVMYCTAVHPIPEDHQGYLENKVYSRRPYNSKENEEALSRPIGSEDISHVTCS